jgi:hypothetical protein
MALVNAGRIPAEAFAPDKRAHSRFANQSAVIALVEYKAFSLLGTTWRIAPIGYIDGFKLTELMIDAEDLRQRSKAEQERSKDAPADIRALHKLAAANTHWIERVVEVIGPLMIPTGKERIRYRLSRYRPFRKLWTNPLMGQSEADIGAAFGFFVLSRTNSGEKNRPDVRLN